MLLACPNLRRVSFAWSRLHDNGVAVIAEKLLSPNSPIRRLCVCKQVHATNAIPLLAAALQQSRLQELEVHDVPLTESGVRRLGFALLTNDSLTKLALCAGDHPLMQLTMLGIQALVSGLVLKQRLELRLGLYNNLYVAVATLLPTQPVASRITLSRRLTYEEQLDEEMDEGDEMMDEEAGRRRRLKRGATRRIGMGTSEEEIATCTLV